MNPMHPRWLSKTTSRSFSLRASLALTTLLALVGCGRTAPDASAPETRDPAAPAEMSSPPAAASAPATTGDREFWEVHQMQGVRVGYTRTSLRREQRDRRELVRIEGLSQMKFTRIGQGVEMRIQYDSTETPEGQVLEFHCTMAQGSQLIQRTEGRVQGDKLLLTTTTMGKTTTTSIPWSPDYRGLLAGEQSLWQAPLQPGETRTLAALVPAINQVGQIEMVARQYEPVEILGQTHELLRIDCTTSFPDGQSLRSVLWTDRNGEILRRREELMNLESFRASQEVALAEFEQAPFDLALGLLVKVDRGLDDPHRSTRIRYVLELDGANPADVFPSSSSQEVKSLGPQKAEAVVYAVRPDRPGNPNAPEDPPSDADRQANNLIQSDHAAIVALAQQVAPEEKDPWKVAVALEKFVKEYITSSNYSHAFATAAQVAESRAGDCTEHAVLLAALARARGIPARVAMGLVYLEQDGKPAFGYHMWNEVYLGDRWIPLDATLGLGGIGAAHLKLAHSNLAATSAFNSFLSVAHVAGRLKIDIAEIE